MEKEYFIEQINLLIDQMKEMSADIKDLRRELFESGYSTAGANLTGTTELWNLVPRMYHVIITLERDL